MAALWTISGSCCDFFCTSDWSNVNPLQLPGFWPIPGFTWPFPLVTLSLVTQPSDCTITDPTWSSVDLLDRSDSKTLHCCSAERTLQGLWVLVLHQKARNVLLTAHVLGVSTAPVAATYALYWGQDSTPTLNVLLALECTTQGVTLFAVQQPVSSLIGPFSCVRVLATPKKVTAAVWEPISGTHRLNTTLCCCQSGAYPPKLVAWAR